MRELRMVVESARPLRGLGAAGVLCVRRSCSVQVTVHNKIYEETWPPTMLTIADEVMDHVHFWHKAESCPLSGVKQTLGGGASTSAFDAKPTFRDVRVVSEAQRRITWLSKSR